MFVFVTNTLATCADNTRCENYEISVPVLSEYKKSYYFVMEDLDLNYRRRVRGQENINNYQCNHSYDMTVIGP